MHCSDSSSSSLPRRPRGPLLLLWGLWTALAVLGGCGSRSIHFAVADTSNTLTGRVHDAITGRELAGATVSLGTAGLSTQSSISGVYKLGPLNSGSFLLRAEAPGYSPRLQGLLLPLRGVPALDLGLVPTNLTGIVGGRVIDAFSGLPIGGVDVRINDQGTTRPPFPPLNLAPVQQATTAADGRFVLGPVGSGRLIVEFSRVDYPLVRVSVDVPAGGSYESTFSLVFDSGVVRGLVRSSQGMRLLTDTQVSVVSTAISTLTSIDGRYRIEHLTGGTTVLEFLAPSHDRTVLTTSVISGRTTVTDVIMRFNRARLSGAVRDENGIPLAAAQVSVPALALTTLTDTSGRYDFGFDIRIANPPVPLAVGAVAQGFALQSVVLVLTPGQDQVQDITLIRNTGNLVGTVFRTPGLVPVPQAVVSLPLIQQTRISDISGRFSFFAIPAQTYQVDVTAVGLTPVTTFATLLSGQTVNVSLTLSP